MMGARSVGVGIQMTHPFLDHDRPEEAIGLTLETKAENRYGQRLFRTINWS
jgi:hypothetical protein